MLDVADTLPAWTRNESNPTLPCHLIEPPALLRALPPRCTAHPSLCASTQIMLPALADEKKRVVEDVAKDRQHAIDAAIVCTMKSRKVMNHQQVGRTAPMGTLSLQTLCIGGRQEQRSGIVQHRCTFCW